MYLPAMGFELSGVTAAVLAFVVVSGIVDWCIAYALFPFRTVKVSRQYTTGDHAAANKIGELTVFSCV